MIKHPKGMNIGETSRQTERKRDIFMCNTNLVMVIMTGK